MDYTEYTPYQIKLCAESVRKKYGLTQEQLSKILEADYPGITDYTKESDAVEICEGFDTSYKSDPDIVLFYYSGSKDSPLPGHGSGEKIPLEKDRQFKKLASVNGWRKMLSNFWPAPFKLDGLTWASVEHYYQGSKFKKNNPSFYKLFSVESNSYISKDPQLAKVAGGKSGKSKGKLVRPSDIIIDDDFFNTGSKNNLPIARCNLDMYRAMYAKFSQNPKLKEVLLSTGTATLTHGTRGVPTTPQHTLMKVRDTLR